VMRIGIVGAGMAGLACAEGLAGQGHEVVLFDKGRGPGGRMSTRRMPTSAGEACFDHGAQYFTVRDGSFRKRVDAWIVDGVAGAWPSAGSEAYVGVPAMNAPVRQMANGQTVHWTKLVTRIECVDLGWRLFDERGEAVDVDIAIVAVPAEQASPLLASVALDLAARAMASASEPCWALMLAFSESVAVARDCWRSDQVVGWAARNNSKPRRIGPESWVVQAGPDWSKRHLQADPDWVAATLKEALSNLLGIELPPCVGTASHRWRFARSGAEGSGAVLDRDRSLGICGDWLIGPRVEAAWMSGTMLADMIRQWAGESTAKHV
jgi:renalase